ncbi:outer membrane lipoprotein-sorting protein [Sulfuricurvum sp.]|uniref:outer membrane lipoprotein-sorting protein n=1 Tax=Sulfuricurvum sp. TaxID=2025608 RepID=UPI003BB194A7
MNKLLFILFFSVSVWAISPDAIIKNVEHNIQSDSGYSKITMSVTTARGERTMIMESWNRGHEKSFIKVLYPKQDRGITFLKVESTMWQYVPKIEKTIKIPSSMMMQSWMGSDFTNDDMAKESSIVDDYNAQLTSEDAKKYTLTLYPKEEAAVVWGKIVMEVEKVHCIPLRAIFYNEEGEQQRILTYSEVKVYGDRYLPTVMTLVPLDKKKNKTVVTMEDVDFNAVIDDSRFTKNALVRYSQ